MTNKLEIEMIHIIKARLNLLPMVIPVGSLDLAKGIIKDTEKMLDKYERRLLDDKSKVSR